MKTALTQFEFSKYRASPDGAIYVILSLLYHAIFLSVSFYCLSIAAVAQEAAPPVAQIRSYPEYILEAYSEANRLLKKEGDPLVHTRRLVRLDEDFDAGESQAVKTSFAADEAKHFRVEVETHFLPAIQKDDKAAATQSFDRLSEIYDLCCRHQASGSGPSIESHLSADNIVFEAETMTREAETKASVTPEPKIFILMAVAIFGLVLIVGTPVMVYRRTKKAAIPVAAVAAHDPSVHVAKPLFLQEVETKAHVNLDTNIKVLRDCLYAFGKPCLENNQLLFGDHVVNGDNEIVDRIKAGSGCYATIFMQDQRVATNVLRPDGSRALDTPLAPGPAYDAVMKGHSSFAGEVKLYDHRILGLYEPILSEGEVIGILFVGL